MTREEELAQLIEEQRKNDTHIIEPERIGRFRVASLDAVADHEDGAGGSLYDKVALVSGTPTIIHDGSVRRGMWRGGSLVQIPHGTWNGYENYECRCPRCRNAATIQQRRMRKNRIARGVPEHLHGTANAYQNYGCRCIDCEAAHAQKNRRWKRNSATKWAVEQGRSVCALESCNNTFPARGSGATQKRYCSPACRVLAHDVQNRGRPGLRYRKRGRCYRGHKLTPDNLSADKRCRTCKNERDRRNLKRYRAAKKAALAA